MEIGRMQAKQQHHHQQQGVSLFNTDFVAGTLDNKTT